MKAQFENRRLLVGSWSVRFALFSVVLILSGALLHRLFGMTTPVALNLFALAFVGAGAAILLATYALVRIWQRGFRGTTSALIAIGISLAILAWPLTVWQLASELPEINDVTTDTERPPPFTELARNRPLGANDPAYPGAAFAELQGRYYGDLRPLILDRDPEEVMELAAQAMRKLRMDVVRESPPDTGVGYVEAIDRTLVLGFYDDVVVRVVDLGSRTRVDIRSASRFGRHDLGRNAERIRALLQALVERLQATVPKTRSTGSRPAAAGTSERYDGRAVRRPATRRRSSSVPRSPRPPSQ